MPYGDRTGPWGRGSRTGRGAGYCAGSDMPGYMNPYVPMMGLGWGRGRGFGHGRGFGRGWGRGFGRGRGFWGRGGYGYSYPDPYYRPPPDYDPYYGPAPYIEPEPDPEEEKKYLERVVDSLEKELKAVKDRLKELVKGKSKQDK